MPKTLAKTPPPIAAAMPLTVERRVVLRAMMRERLSKR
jgi:hypothetical protein